MTPVEKLTKEYIEWIKRHQLVPRKITISWAFYHTLLRDCEGIPLIVEDELKGLTYNNVPICIDPDILKDVIYFDV